jgi:hypothetical protein
VSKAGMGKCVLKVGERNKKEKKKKQSEEEPLWRRQNK